MCIRDRRQGALGATGGVGVYLAASAAEQCLLQMPLGRLGIVAQENVQRGAGLVGCAADLQGGNGLQLDHGITQGVAGPLKTTLGGGRLEGHHLERPDAVSPPEPQQGQGVGHGRSRAQDGRRPKVVDTAPVADGQKQAEERIIEQGKVDLEAHGAQAEVADLSLIHI